MKRTFLYIILTAIALSGCYPVDNDNAKSLSPITFNDVSGTINVNIGDALVYSNLQVSSSLPLKYQWAYGKKSTSASAKEYDMVSMEVISDKPDIQYTFTHIGSYILRLRVDNGEDIKYKYFTLNVNSGLDEGLLLLCNDDTGKGSLTFVKKRTDDEVAQNSQEIWTDIFSIINKNQTISKGTDMYMSFHIAKEIQYAQLLIATDDEEASIYKLEPKTFELLATNTMRTEFGTYCAGFSGDAASGSTYNYVFIRGGNGHTYRYDLFGDFIGERTDATAEGIVTHNKMLVYKKARKPILYNEDCMYQPGNAKVTKRELAGHKIVNLYSDRDNNKTYVIFRNETKANDYVIMYTTGSLAALKKVTTFTTDNLNMDENSIMTSSLNSGDVYYSYANAVYRWGLVSKPAETPAITLPAGEEICDLCVNYMGDFADESAETLLYIATYNPNRASQHKGSLYVYDIRDNSLLKSYEGICDRPEKIMYKYRIS